MRACLLALVVVSSLSNVASADEPETRVTVLPVTHVVGRRQVPSVVPILSRARMRYRAPELSRHSTGAIVESVTRPPF